MKKSKFSESQIVNILKEAEVGLAVDELTAINSTRWDFSEGTGRFAIGFTGTVGFKLAPKNKIKQQWQEYWDGADEVMQSLAQFAFYRGVGHHSTIGMGQVGQSHLGFLSANLR